MSVEITGPAQLRAVIGASPRSAPLRRDSGNFSASLDRLLDPVPPEDATVEGEGDLDGVALSRHAEARLASRGLEFGPTERAELGRAITTLEGRGAKKALVLTGRQAWIVGVPKRTVITVMSREEALGQVFTDLDATYLAG